jgi:hypothetical protein
MAPVIAPFLRESFSAGLCDRRAAARTVADADAEAEGKADAAATATGPGGGGAAERGAAVPIDNTVATVTDVTNSIMLASLSDAAARGVRAADYVLCHRHVVKEG